MEITINNLKKFIESSEKLFNINKLISKKIKELSDLQSEIDSTFDSYTMKTINTIPDETTKIDDLVLKISGILNEDVRELKINNDINIQLIEKLSLTIESLTNDNKTLTKQIYEYKDVIVIQKEREIELVKKIDILEQKANNYLDLERYKNKYETLSNNYKILEAENGKQDRTIKKYSKEIREKFETITTLKEELKLLKSEMSTIKRSKN